MWEDYSIFAEQREISIGRVMINGHDYVDLGLSVVWATCNVGAEKAEEYGDYYAWGETKEAQWNNYSEENCKSYGVGAGDISGDGRYDVARVKWGGTWRMPTRAEFDELQEECEWEWTKRKDIYGYKVKGPSGSSIFLPAAGRREGSTLSDEGTEGSDYWSGTPFDDDNRYASCGYPMNEDHDWNGVYRYNGLPVRAVADITGGVKIKREISWYIDDKIYYLNEKKNWILDNKKSIVIITIVVGSVVLGVGDLLCYHDTGEHLSFSRHFAMYICLSVFCILFFGYALFNICIILLGLFYNIVFIPIKYIIVLPIKKFWNWIKRKRMIRK